MTRRTDPVTHYVGGDNSALRVRIDNVERDVGHIESQVNTIRDTMATRGDIAGILTRLEAMSTQSAAMGRPNYSLMVSIVGVAMVFLTMVGGFAYWPINAGINDLKHETKGYVTQKQYDADAEVQNKTMDRLRVDVQMNIQQQRYNADMAKIDSRLGNTEKSSLTKEEFALVANERAASIANLMSRVQRLEDRCH